MNRSVDIEILGVTYPLCLTLRAYTDICERYGDMKSCMMRLDEVAGQFEAVETGEVDEAGKPVKIVNVIIPEDTAALIEEYTWLLGTLLWAGYQSTGGESPQPPLASTIQDILFPAEVPDIQRKVLSALTLGQKREVGAEAPKNGAGAAGEQAPGN